MTRCDPLLLWILLASLGMAGACQPATVAAPVAPPRAKPHWVDGQLPVEAFVAAQVRAARGEPVIVYVGASWCEPCQRFHRALDQGQLDAALSGVHFLGYDYDSAKDALEAASYTSKLIPLFALPNADGRCGSQSMEGSIKGSGALNNILPRLMQLLGRPAVAPLSDDTIH